MKQFRKRKLNNKGLSLVEILVTVVILALISAPIIDSFIHAINVNSQSRTIQNGTAVAQDVAELFETFDLEYLVESYSGQEKNGITVSCDSNGIYTFTGIPMNGADGEEFVVDVKLDPTTYQSDFVGSDEDQDEEEQKKIVVNDVQLPVFSGLYGTDSIMLYSQYAGPDDTIKEEFRKNGLNENICNKLNTYEQRKYVQKKTNIDVKCTYIGNDQEGYPTYTYVVKVDIVYTYDNNVVTATATTAAKYLEKTYNNKTIHNIYMLCPIYDRYGYFGECTDSIYINYSYDSNGSNVEAENMYFYIAEQDMKSIDPDTGVVRDVQRRIPVSNLYVNGNSYTNYIGNTGTSKISNSKLQVYTNIGDSMYGLTYGDGEHKHSTEKSLYDMKLTVRLKGDDKVVTTFSTAK